MEFDMIERSRMRTDRVQCLLRAGRPCGAGRAGKKGTPKGDVS